MSVHNQDIGMYENILVPTDGSDDAERGIEHAMDLAEDHGAHLHVLFVVDETVYGTTPAFSSYEAFLEEIADEAEDLVEDVVETATERGIESTTSVLRGLPHEVILEYADDHDIDLVVMGKRGAAGVEAPHMGSVTDRVIRAAAVPVVPI
ncbi:universal stress protein [Halomicroarcula sp. S1AR25-4]|uniref:universal stress protein n=1 Tax=Haloarcula sp. S1AR25-4 TaxID=2950538 RepID=UPI0028754A84|nr:universal stress protein [Halomicroarcula sp. S1AR25-4]MDS0279526.1 universal stress protein [Halomicroarcula sp. S1AR25-4]